MKTKTDPDHEINKKSIKIGTLTETKLKEEENGKPSTQAPRFTRVREGRLSFPVFITRTVIRSQS